MFPTSTKTKGFTLIELLVVIAIIGLLSSVVLASLNSARVKGRDSNRVSTLRQFERALELYHSANGQYPDTSSCGGGYSCADCTAYIGTTMCGTTLTLTQALGPYFAGNTIPKDPKLPSYWPPDGGYLYIGNKTSYCIFNNRNPENMNNIPKNMRKLACVINSVGNCTSLPPYFPPDVYTTPGYGWGNVMQVGSGCSL